MSAALRMEPPSTRFITVLNESRRRVRTRFLKHAVGVALSQHGHADAEVCVLLTSDDRVQELNRDFRTLDEPTDVLTFPSGEGAGGDIAIAVAYAERQANVRGVTLEQELAYLAIHGALHLAGFDDECEADRAEMVSEMNRAAVAAGLPPDQDWASLLHQEAA